MGSTSRSPRKSHNLSGPSKVWFVLACSFVLIALSWPKTSSALQANGISQAWERARQTGVYDFSADIKQAIMPQSTVRNVGRATKVQTLHLEGQANLPSQQLYLTLWSQGGSVLQAGSGVEIKVDGDHAYVRKGSRDWEEINNFMGAFAPQGDFLAYLAAAKEITDQGTETRQSAEHGSQITFTRYTFHIDGRSYARYLRDQMERQLAEGGELPPGVTLDLPKSYVDMTGQGELWVDDDGLPLRQILRLQFPPRTDEQEIHAEVAVDFRFDPARVARSTYRASSIGLDVSRSTVDLSPFPLILSA